MISVEMNTLYQYGWRPISIQPLYRDYHITIILNRNMSSKASSMLTARHFISHAAEDKQSSVKQLRYWDTGRSIISLRGGALSAIVSSRQMKISSTCTTRSLYSLKEQGAISEEISCLYYIEIKDIYHRHNAINSYVA